MPNKSYYEELLAQLEVVQSNEQLINALEKKLPNNSLATNYESWVESSLEFLRDNENLFVNEVVTNAIG